jgi:hypothetical protein
MQQTGKEPNQTITVPVEIKMIVFGAILLGILLLTIGNSQNTKWVIYAGRFILPAALFGGGFYLKEESTSTRITLLILAGVTVIYGLLGVASITSLFG